MSKKLNVLYLPSTPLNILVCVAHAIEHQATQNAKLILIDQTLVTDNPYIKALKAWKESPFIDVEIMSGKASGWQKYQERQSNFLHLAEVKSSFLPDVIAVGSDRRVEFQYLMHLCQSSVKPVNAWYLDDGYYSYAGRPYKWYKDLVSSAVKKMAYGFWWEEPKTIGSSSLIDKAWVFRPELVHPSLKTKQLKPIGNNWFHSEEFTVFAKEVFKAFQINETFFDELQQLDLLWVLPHPADYADDELRAQVDALLERAFQAGLRIGVKYHPRFTERDTFSYQSRFNALLMPNSIAFEFLLPILAKQLLMISGLGTSLMTAKWLGEALNVNAIISKNSETAKSDQALYSTMDIPVYNDCQKIRVEGYR